MGETALIIGASGLVGNELLSQLLQNEDYSIVKIFVRKSLEINHKKLEQVVVDFDNLTASENEIKGEVVFCCIGTTIKKAGSKEVFTKVDYTLPFEFATLAKNNGVQQFVLISSLGADKNSSNFYLKVKGEIEEALQKIDFNNLIIVRPSMLLGDRKEFRFGELTGKFFMKLLFFVFIGKLKKYKAIEANVVAKAMIVLAKNNSTKLEIVDSDKLQVLGI